MTGRDLNHMTIRGVPDTLLDEKLDQMQSMIRQCYETADLIIREKTRRKDARIAELERMLEDTGR